MSNVSREQVERWLAAYVEAWRTDDPERIGDLFTEDASYSPFPWTGSWQGRDAIVNGWLGHRDWERRWTFRHEILAADADTAVIHGQTHYDATEDEPESEFSNIWVVRFGGDGRAREFREWWVQRPTVAPNS
jgi:uncharacterized protein (TIGR02246 family)